jgi:hypothetical protein
VPTASTQSRRPYFRLQIYDFRFEDGIGAGIPDARGTMSRQSAILNLKSAMPS